MRVLVVTHDPVGDEMGGNAIRAYELTRALAAHVDATLAAPPRPSGPPSGVAVAPFDPRTFAGLREAIGRTDVAVVQAIDPLIGAWLRAAGARVVVDLYDMAPFLRLEAHRRRPPAIRHLRDALAVDAALDALDLGTQFVCAGERQRDLWIGLMTASRLIGPELYDRDPTLRSVLDTVPFGVPAEPPAPTGTGGARSRFAAIAADDEVVLWNGGIWNWLDPVAAVRAVEQLVERRPRARLVFMGRAPLDPGGAREADAARQLAAERGLLDRVVFFNDVWVPYAERADWLLDAACAVSTHVEHLETRYAFRTRLLDCFWTGLPVVCTAGDELAGRVARDDLGAVVPPGDPAALARALEAVLARGRHAYAPALRAAAEAYAWPAVARPLVRYVTADPPPPRPAGLRAARAPRVLRTAGVRAARRALIAAHRARP